MILINFGCGTHYHASWINFDMMPASPEVRPWDVRGRLPFSDASVDAVYHSHVLEHLTAEQGAAFLRECHRILRHEGILRVVVPDLEGIARAYLDGLERADRGDDATLHEWTRLELIDQAARARSGGEMLPWLRTCSPDQLAVVRRRMGQEVDTMLGAGRPRDRTRRFTVGRITGKVRDHLALLLASALGGGRLRAAWREGSFRQTGEVHRVMYDRVILSRVLRQCGFAEPGVMTAEKSRIPHFAQYGLDAKDGVVRKPDSLFMEAVRP